MPEVGIPMRNQSPELSPEVVLKERWLPPRPDFCGALLVTVNSKRDSFSSCPVCGFLRIGIKETVLSGLPLARELKTEISGEALKRSLGKKRVSAEVKGT